MVWTSDEAERALDEVTSELAALLPERVARRHQAIPIAHDEASRHVTVAVANPADLSAYDELRFAIGRGVQLVAAPPAALARAMARWYPAAPVVSDAPALPPPPVVPPLPKIPSYEESERSFRRALVVIPAVAGVLAGIPFAIMQVGRMSRGGHSGSRGFSLSHDCDGLPGRAWSIEKPDLAKYDTDGRRFESVRLCIRDKGAFGELVLRRGTVLIDEDYPSSAAALARWIPYSLPQVPPGLRCESLDVRGRAGVVCHDEHAVVWAWKIDVDRLRFVELRSGRASIDRAMADEFEAALVRD